MKKTFEIIRKDFSQFYALLIKDVILHLRQWKSNLFQLIAPVIIMFIIFILQVLVDNVFTQTDELKELENKGGFNVTYTPLDFFSASFFVEAISNKTAADKILLYFDDNEVESTFTDKLSSSLLPYQITFEEAPSVDDIDVVLYDNLEIFLSNDSYGLEYVGGLKLIKINKTFANYIIQPESYDFEGLTVTKSSEFCGMLNRLFASSGCEMIIGGTFMNLVNSHHIKHHTNGYMNIQTSFAQMPFTVEPFKVVFDLVSNSSTMFYPIIVLIALPSILYALVYEKESKLLEMMKLLGLKGRVYYTESFLFNLFWYLLSIIGFVAMGLILQHPFFYLTSPLVIILILVGTALNVLGFAYFLSSFIRSSFAATIVGYGMALLVPLFGVLIDIYLLSKSYTWKFLLVFPPLAIGDAWYHALVQAGTGYGLETVGWWNNIDFVIGLAFLYFDVLLCFVGAYILGSVIPKKWGVQKKNLFSEAIRYLKSKWSNKANADEISDYEVDDDIKELREKILKGEFSESELKGIIVTGLRKAFGKFVAVKNIYFQVDERECFGLLGPNGAGKSTTLSILAGMYSQTFGEANIAGSDISKNIEKIRQSLGLCPQFSIYWKDLTPRETLLFFTRIKGIAFGKEYKQVDDLVKRVGLNFGDEAEETEMTKSKKFWSTVRKIIRFCTLGAFGIEQRKAGQLSGGMLRRMAIAISLCGSPAVVLLDEPTTGLDPSSKRSIWDVILKEKQSRCVVLTTHSMEEADALADRIGIMSHGRLLCVGNTTHLKRKYGNGYTVELVYNDKEHVDEIMENIMEKCGGKKSVIKKFSNHITYQIQSKDDNEERFYVSAVFEELEKYRGKGIKDFELKQTSLEDVFLNVIAKDEDEFRSKKTQNTIDTKSFYNESDAESEDIGLPEEEVQIEDPIEEKKKEKDTAPCGEILKVVRKNFIYQVIYQTFVLLEKNFLVQLRGWWLTLGEILFPLLVILIMIIISGFVDLTLGGNYYLHPDIIPLEYQTLQKCSRRDNGKCYRFVYTTNNNMFAEEVMDSIIDKYSVLEEEDYLQFDYDGEMLDWMSVNPNSTVIGISFSNNTKDFLNNNVTSYTLLYNATRDLTNQVYEYKAIIDSRIYYVVQNDYRNENVPEDTYKVSKQKFPKVDDNPTTGESLMFTQIGPLSFATIAMIVFMSSLYQLVSEKEKELKQALQMVGMKNISYFLSWFISFSVVAVLSSAVTVLAGVLIHLEIFLYTNQFLLCMLFFGYSFTLINFAFALSTILKTAKAALIIGFLVLAGSFVINFAVSAGPILALIFSLEGGLQIFPYLLQIFYPPFNFAKIFGDMVDKSVKIYDDETNTFVSNEGFGWANLFDWAYKDSFGTQVKTQGTGLSFVWMGVNCIVFFIVFVYLEIALKGENGFFFLFKPKFYGIKIGRDSTSDLRDENELKTMDEDLQKNYRDSLPKEKDLALSIINFKKTYKSLLGKSVTAVKGIDVSVKRGEVTGFLGHNGAGKSTTINSIAGILLPTSGKIFVNNLDVEYKRRAIQRDLGVCIQHEVLWDELTAKEHIRLFSRMKGIDRKVSEEVKDRLSEVSLYDVRNKLSRKFSGGMKRRLNVAMSFVKDPKIVLMDEPSTGLDPFSKREIWNLINKKKEKGTSILLTSHSMEEADKLSDKIMILQKGEVVCVGDSLHLKSKYSAGFVLKFLVLKEKKEEFLKLMKDKLPNAVLFTKNAGNYIYNVDPQYFREMIDALKTFENLQRTEDKLLKDFAVSSTTLEDVYLKVTKEEFAVEDAELETVAPFMGVKVEKGEHVTDSDDGSTITLTDEDDSKKEENETDDSDDPYTYVTVTESDTETEEED